MENEQSMGLSLIKKGKKGLAYVLFSRLGLILALLLVNILILLGVYRWFERFLLQIAGGAVVFVVAMVLYLMNCRMNATAKLTWLFLIMLMPLPGAVLLWFTRTEIGHRAEKARLQQLTDATKNSIVQDETTFTRLAGEDEGTAGLARYIACSGCYPVFDKTSVTYFPGGEAKWKEMLHQLEKAEHFIFLEYFIVDEGLMWGKILEILARKAKEGVQIWMMYDGSCEFATLPHDYPKRLEALGIACRMFAPVTPFISTHYNYRDHRKILVIDGHTAFTGGVNLADEYINHVEKYGRWKDAAVMLKGEAVKSFTLMFLQMWSFDKKETDFAKYLNVPTYAPAQAKGFVIPYADSPLDDDKVGENVYIDILNRAERYVHIMTPYLILDGETEAALKFAAQRGVDVKLILPGIPDKAVPYALAKTHYASLLDAGVRIYEFTPGFVHAKVFVSDDKKAVVGTINLDYRSLYHHFECAVYMQETDCIGDVEADFANTLRACAPVTKETVKNIKLSQKLLGRTLKVIAPLL